MSRGHNGSAFAPLPRTCAEFFAGMGLMRLGLARQGWRVLYANDLDAGKRAMYQAHFGELPDDPGVPHAGPVDPSDVHRVPAERVPDVTLATASFPCPDLSQAGGGLGMDGPQSSAFWAWIELLTDLGPRRPPLVLLENVPGMLTRHAGINLSYAARALDALGYSVDVFAIDAAAFVPQSRPRLFVVGLFGAETVPLAELPAYTQAPLRPAAIIEFMRRHPEIHWRPRRLPDLPPRRLSLAEVVDDLPDDSPVWWSPRRVDTLLAQMQPRHATRANAMMAGQRWSFGTIYRRTRGHRLVAELRRDGLAGCLRPPKGGSSRQILVKAGLGRFMARWLTAREAARLMGAGEYRLPASDTEALRGLGDAVCVPAIAWIAEQYLNPLVQAPGWYRERRETPAEDRPHAKQVWHIDAGAAAPKRAPGRAVALHARQRGEPEPEVPLEFRQWYETKVAPLPDRERLDMIGAALVVLEFLKRGAPLDINALTTPSGARIAGITPGAIRAVCREFGVEWPAQDVDRLRTTLQEQGNPEVSSG